MKNRSVPYSFFVGAITLCVSLQAAAVPMVSASALEGAAKQDASVTDTSDNQKAQVIEVKSSGGSFKSSSSSSYSRPAASAPVYRPVKTYTAPAAAPVAAPAATSNYQSQKPSMPVSAPAASSTASTAAAPATAPASKGWFGWGSSKSAPAAATTPAPAAPAASSVAAAPAAAPASKGWFGWGSSKSTPAAATTPAAPPVAKAPVATAPSNATVTLNTNGQKGVGSSFNGVTLSNKRQLNKNTFEGVTDSGQKIRYHENADGTHTITSRVKTDPSTGQVVANFKYNSQGKKTAAVFNTTDGSQVRVAYHKNGNNRVVTTHPDGTRVISDSRRGGSIERPYRDSSGRSMVQSTYYDRHSNSTYVRNYYYDSSGYRMYSPSYAFDNGFYSGLVFGAMWSASYPVYYPYSNWGTWYSNPWLFTPTSPYAYYFAPSPYYSSSLYWMTDYVMADTLAEHYRNEADNNAQLQQQVQSLQSQVNQLQANDANVQNQLKNNAANAAIDAQTKQQLANQVGEEMKAQQQQQAVPMSLALQNANYLFVATHELEASYSDANQETQECTLDEGDIFQVSQVTPQDDSTPIEQRAVNVLVKTVKKSDTNCPAGTSVAMSASDLQDMKNDLSARINKGTKAMYDHQGQSGLPGNTPTAAAQVLVPAGGDVDAVKAQLDQSAQQAESGQQGFEQD